MRVLGYCLTLFRQPGGLIIRAYRPQQEFLGCVISDTPYTSLLILAEPSSIAPALAPPLGGSGIFTTQSL